MTPGVRLLAVTVSGLLLAGLGVVSTIVKPLQHFDYGALVIWGIIHMLILPIAYVFGRVGTGRERDWNYVRVHTSSLSAWILGGVASTLLFLGPTGTLHWANVVFLVVAFLMIVIPTRQFWRSMVAQEQRKLRSNEMLDG